MKPNDTKAEIDFYVQQSKSLQGEITIPILQSELRIGYQKAKLVMEAISKEMGLSETPEEIYDATNLQPFSLSEPLVNEEIEQPGEAEEIPNRDSQELAVVEAANTGNLGLGLGEVLKWFDLGDSLTQCKPTDETTDIQIGRGIEVLAGVKNWSELGIGDLLNALEDRGHGELIPQIISQIGLEESYPTIKRYQATARACSNDLRELPNIKFSHLAEVATSRFSKDPVEQDRIVREVLTEASEKGYNVSQTREACLNRKGKSTQPTPPPDAKKPGYILIDRESLLRGDIVIWASHKEPLCNESALCISIENMDFSSECHGNSLHVWLPIAVKDEMENVNQPELEEV